MNDAIRALEWKLWRQSMTVAFFVFLFWAVYVFFLDTSLTLQSLSRMFIGSSGVLLSVSLGLASSAYYFPPIGKYVVYRKYFGLLGYYFSIADGTLLLYSYPERYFYGFFQNFWTGDIFFGFLAMGILTVMAIISNKPLIPLIGAQRWRSLLRLGFLALFFLVYRALLLEGDMWLAWLSHPVGLPPVRLLLTGLVFLVLFARLSLVFHSWWGKKPMVSPVSPTPVTPSSSTPLS